MKDFLVLLREPDGRKNNPSLSFQKAHQQHWNEWLEKMMKDGVLIGGKPLTLQGVRIKDFGSEVIPGPHQIGDEIVGGFLMIKAVDLKKATEYISSCPVFESDGYAEVREIM